MEEKSPHRWWAYLRWPCWRCWSSFYHWVLLGH